MTIRKGEDWGAPGALAPDAAVTSDDVGAARLLQQAWSPGAAPVELGLLGGDLHTTLGGPRHDEIDLRSGHGTRYPMDLGTVRLDHGEPQVFVAHLVATASRWGRLWSSRTVTVMNAAFDGPSNLGPRAHPNDGRLNVADGVLPPGERRTGRQRARTGTHLPHPALAERRVRHVVVDSEVPLWVVLDGRRIGPARRLEIDCHPDAWTAVV